MGLYLVCFIWGWSVVVGGSGGNGMEEKSEYAYVMRRRPKDFCVLCEGWKEWDMRGSWRGSRGIEEEIAYGCMYV
jgi:hypothetical protein